MTDKFIYHITDVDNLPSVITTGAIYCKNSASQQSISHIDCAYQQIQDRRASKRVPCGSGGTLHDYVPFYFCLRSPMLFAIHKGSVPTYPKGQADMVYLVSSISAIEAERLQYCFTDGHAAMAVTDFYQAPADLAKLDWNVIKAKYWAPTDDDKDRVRRKQAEFLVRNYVPWSCIKRIGVQNDDVLGRVVDMLEGLAGAPIAKCVPNWYY